MRIFTAPELGPTDIPIDYVMKDGAFDIYPEVQQKGYFNILFRKNTLTVTAGEYIGLIPINDQVAIQIQPKVPLGNLVHLITKAGQRVVEIDLARTYDEVRYFSPTILDFIMRSLLLELRKIEKYGVYRKYVSVQRNDGIPKGKLLIKETMIKDIMRQENHKVSYSFYELTQDTPENRLVKYTLWLILNYFQDLNYEPRTLTREAYNFYEMFNSVTLDKERSFLNKAQEAIQDKRIPVVRQYYENVLKICLLVLDKSSLAIEGYEQGIRLPCFVINMSEIFESYLRNILREDTTLENTRILDGNTSEGMRSLFSDKTDPKANPDVVVMKNGKIALILDAKYKERPKREDFNQVITYCLSYGVGLGIFVCPKTDDILAREQYEGEISGIRIFTYYFDLAGDISNEERGFINYVQSKIQSIPC